MSNDWLNKNIYNVFSLLITITVMFILQGCGSSEITKRLSAEEYYALGMNKFRNEDFVEAIEDFKVVSLEYQGSKVADSAQFFLAECRFKREEYILAAFEYDLLVRNMPSSAFVPAARFRRATCYYELSPKSYLDQIDTRKAIDEYQEFLEYHPKDSLAAEAARRISELNSKLAKKDYENAVTYMHMEYYKAANYYFDQVLEKYYDTQYAEPALLNKVEALVHRKRYAEARDEIKKFISKYPESDLKSDAIKLETDIENKLSESAKQNQKLQTVEDLKKQPSKPEL